MRDRRVAPRDNRLAALVMVAAWWLQLGYEHRRAIKLGTATSRKKGMEALPAHVHRPPQHDLGGAARLACHAASALWVNDAVEAFAALGIAM